MSPDLAESTNLESSAKCDSQPPTGETANSYEGGLAEREDNEIGGDVNKEVLIGGDTENNRWAVRHRSQG